MAAVPVLLSVAALLVAAAPVAALWRSRVERLVAFALAAFGGLVIAFQALGCIAAGTGVGAVTAWNLVIASLVISCATWTLRWRARRGSAREAAGAREASRVAAPDMAAALSVAVVSGAFLIVAVVSALSAPPRGWDVLTYHLPRAASWLLHGDLGPYGLTGAFYPGNAEFPILALLFTGSDRLVPLIQIPFALLGAAALFGLARRLGAGIASAAVSVSVFLMAPIVFFQATVAKDDVIVAGLVLAGALLFVRSLGARESADRTRSIAMAGFAMGLALGTKYSILPFVAGVVPVAFLLLILALPRGRPRLAGAAKSVLILVAAAALPSAFWFVRNAVVTGNPIEPLSLKVGEWVAWPGLVEQELRFVSDTRHWWAFPWLDRHLDSTYSGSVGFGAAFAVFFVPGLVLCLVGGLRRGVRPETRAAFLTVPALVVLGIAAWWVGKHHLPRFLIPTMALACAPIGLVWEAAVAKARIALLFVLLAAIAFSTGETMRAVFREDDITWSYRRGTSRDAFYHMPEFIHRLPVGTKILLLKPSEHDFYQTYRYPLVGSLPGNDVMMEQDYGVTFDLKRDGALLAHAALVDTGVEYLFMRTLGLRPFTTWFDNYPWLYKSIMDTIEFSYPWYREAVAVTPEGERLGAGHVVTKVYRVIH